MRRGSYDEEAARQPLLDSAFAGAAGAAASGSGRAGSGGGTSSRGLSPDRAAGEDGHPVHLRSAATPGGSIRLIKRPSNTAQEGEEQHQGLVLKTTTEEEDEKHESDVRELQLEVEVVAGAVAEAVAEAVQEAVQEAVHDAVQQALEDQVSFDVTANIYTLVAVTGVILFWRGVWNTWDALFGTDSLASNLGSMGVGLLIMSLIRILDLPLVQGLPGG